MEVVRKFTVVEKVIDYVGAAGEVLHNKNNFDGDQRVGLRLVTNDPKKPTRQIWLSPGLSKLYRDKDITLGNILAMDYSVDDRGIFFVQRPEGQTFTVKVEACKVEELAVDFDEINIEELIAF